MTTLSNLKGNWVVLANTIKRKPCLILCPDYVEIAFYIYAKLFQHLDQQILGGKPELGFD
ncbi:CLUMA_CG021046, isoform A [Clunio marinus]|uniref:CLUMA_CG021046, isoform A n=1 Tax=Clunio marinus TaxID=568069 RepID=A0A1J1J715_9DIPT|nr:CLUMA_CG021046, isoform A [Clunio marinus]